MRSCFTSLPFYLTREITSNRWAIKNLNISLNLNDIPSKFGFFSWKGNDILEMILSISSSLMELLRIWQTFHPIASNRNSHVRFFLIKIYFLSDRISFHFFCRYFRSGDVQFQRWFVPISHLFRRIGSTLWSFITFAASFYPRCWIPWIPSSQT